MFVTWTALHCQVSKLRPAPIRGLSSQGERHKQRCASQGPGWGAATMVGACMKPTGSLRHYGEAFEWKDVKKCVFLVHCFR